MPSNNSETNPTKEPVQPQEQTNPHLSQNNETIILGTWNLYNFGRSKSDEEIAFIAQTIKEFDVIAIQEVSTKRHGAQAVARLDDALDRLGTSWDYVISASTNGNGIERYAFLWKTNRMMLRKSWLDSTLEKELDREPFLAVFSFGENSFTLANFHAVPRTKNPALENSLLYRLDQVYEENNLIVLGDFNLAQSDIAFDDLKARDLKPAFLDQPTTIKMIRASNGEHLANPLDNIFYESDEFNLVSADIKDFTFSFEQLQEARTISDHIPIFIKLTLK